MIDILDFQEILPPLTEEEIAKRARNSAENLSKAFPSIKDYIGRK